MRECALTVIYPYVLRRCGQHLSWHIITAATGSSLSRVRHGTARPHRRSTAPRATNTTRPAARGETPDTGDGDSTVMVASPAHSTQQTRPAGSLEHHDQVGGRTNLGDSSVAQRHGATRAVGWVGVVTGPHTHRIRLCFGMGFERRFACLCLIDFLWSFNVTLNVSL